MLLYAARYISNLQSMQDMHAKRRSVISMQIMVAYIASIFLFKCFMNLNFFDFILIFSIIFMNPNFFDSYIFCAVKYVSMGQAFF